MMSSNALVSPPDDEKNENLDPKLDECTGLEKQDKMKLLVGTCVLKIRLHNHNIGEVPGVSLMFER